MRQPSGNNTQSSSSKSLAGLHGPMSTLDANRLCILSTSNLHCHEDISLFIDAKSSFVSPRGEAGSSSQNSFRCFCLIYANFYLAHLTTAVCFACSCLSFLCCRIRMTFFFCQIMRSPCTYLCFFCAWVAGATSTTTTSVSCFSESMVGLKLLSSSQKRVYPAEKCSSSYRVEAGVGQADR